MVLRFEGVRSPACCCVGCWDMRCCWREVDEARVFGPCWAGAAVAIVRGASVVAWKVLALELEVGHIRNAILF